MSTPPSRLAYLGPPGTFTEAALLSVPEATFATFDPRPSIADAIAAVRRGDADAAMVPLENSVEGSVNITLDELAFGVDELAIRREVLLPITISLLARPGVALSDITAVLSMPHGAAQCRNWLGANLPTAAIEASSSTAEAARLVALSSDPIAALGAPIAAKEYGIDILVDDVGDNPNATTRFVLIGRADSAPPAPTGSDRTSAVVFIGDDHPGALLELLEEFAVRGVNLTRIESRPTKQGMGRYCFFVDTEGHVADARVGEALMGLKRRCADVRFLGSYGRADVVASAVPGGVRDEDFTGAADWLKRIRTGS
ncbi:MAG: prephenate dehydratase [Mycobacteriales bacterium]